MLSPGFASIDCRELPKIFDFIGEHYCGDDKADEERSGNEPESVLLHYPQIAEKQGEKHGKNDGEKDFGYQGIEAQGGDLLHRLHRG